MSFRYFSLGKSLSITAGTLVIMVILLACVSSVFSAPTLAAVNTYFYYDQLDSLSKKFYDAIDDIYMRGYLKSGNYEYDLIKNKVITPQQAKAYLEDNQQLESAFSIAKDAFMLDKNVFYVDFDKLNLSIAENGNEYTATLGAGVNSDYYVDGGASSASEIGEKVADYQSKLYSLVAGTSSGATMAEKIRLANFAILSSTNFGYGLDMNNVATEKTAYVYSAYGALVNHVAVNEGFARLLKDVLDTLGIENILVKGEALNNIGAYQPAMWNYVKLADGWYMVDVALNSLSQDKSKYLLVGQDACASSHVASTSIGLGQKTISYPTLKLSNYK